MTKREMQRKIKLGKAKALLLQMTSPVSIVELEKANNVKKGTYQSLFNLLKAKNLIIRSGERKRELFWIAVSKAEKKEKPSLADAVYIHKPDGDDFKQKYKAQSAEARESYKSARVNVGISQIYNG